MGNIGKLLDFNRFLFFIVPIVPKIYCNLLIYIIWGIRTKGTINIKSLFIYILFI